MPDPGIDWVRARVLFDELSSLDAPERERRLSELDPAMRAELETLLRGHAEGGAFDDLAGRMDSGRRVSAGGTTDGARKALEAHLVDRYRLVREIGEGGMSVVYLAEDLRHERRVALKVLKPELAALVGAGRFLAEIRTTANLQHPHVLPLFDSGEADGYLYYVMPFVQDESLRQRLARERQLPVQDAVDIGCDVAGALEHAHGEGVIHRDVKPENILLTEGGALVADFGVALILTTEEGADRRTEIGTRVGTPRYMSPEQATGSHPVGPATDVYALGCVLYEMLTGVPPHDGRTVERIVAQSVAGEHVPVGTHRPSVPADLAAVVMRALEPIPADRYRSAAELASALLATRATIPAGRRGVGRWLPPTAVAGTVAAALAAVVWFGPSRPDSAVARTEVTSRQVTFVGDLLNATISPDGSTVAYIAGREGMEQRLVIQPVDGGAATEVHRSAQPIYDPQWSPDNASISFTTALTTRTFVVPRAGVGRPEQVPSTHVYATWSPDGERLAGWSAKRADVTITDLSTRTTIDSIPFGFSIEWVLGVRWAHTRDRLALAIVRGRESGLWTLDLERRELVPVVSDTLQLRHPVWSPEDRSLYYSRFNDERSSEIWSVGVAADGTSSERPRRVIGPLPTFIRHGIQPSFSISADGTRLLYVEHLGLSNLSRVDVAEDGTVESIRALTSGTAARTTPRLSPDGREVAYVQSDSRGSHVALMDLGTQEPRQLTFLDGQAWSPAWSRDADRIAFGSSHTGLGVWLVDRSGTTTRVDGARYELANHIAWGALPGVLVQEPGDRGLQLLALSDAGERSAESAFGSALLYDVRPSPSGRWVAIYEADGPVSALVVTAADGSERREVRRDYVPVGWTADEAAIYAMPGLRGSNLTEVHVVPVSGAPPRSYLTLPFAVKPWEVSISTDGRTVVAAVEDPRTDAWVVEEFDGGR